MPLIIRVDVDRPYGRSPIWRHVASRISSDFRLPRIDSLGYLRELSELLHLFNHHDTPAYVFFRECTLPSRSVIELMQSGGHRLGLHLENSRTFDTFVAEKRRLELAAGTPIRAVSKHGSGTKRYGRTHYAPYEPLRYEEWCSRSGVPVFMGNLEDPRVKSYEGSGGISVFPAAFWLEQAWRNVNVFTIDWLISHAMTEDVVLLIHPENTLGSTALRRDLERLLHSCPSRILE